MKTKLTSAQSIALDCDRKRFSRSGVLRRLHLHGEAQVLGRLLGDPRDRGHRRAGVAQHHVLDVLRPDRGKSADARSGAAPPSAAAPFKRRRREIPFRLLASRRDIVVSSLP